MIETRSSIDGVQSVQDFNTRLIAALEPSGAAGELTRYITAGLHRWAVIYTHVDTGALRGAQRMEVNGLRGRVYLDPSARNPRSGQLASVYGFYEHERGGEHAFYERALDHEGDLVVEATELFFR